LQVAGDSAERKREREREREGGRQGKRRIGLGEWSDLPSASVGLGELG